MVKKGCIEVKAAVKPLLYIKVKKLAAESGTSVAAVIEAALYDHTANVNLRPSEIRRAREFARAHANPSDPKAAVKPKTLNKTNKPENKPGKKKK